MSINKIMRNIKILIEYDGTNYCGWQRQKNGISIQELVEKAVCEITGEDISIIGSSRTDAGVHAKAMAANFHTSSKIPVDRFPPALNTKLPNDIVVFAAQEVPVDFHSRYSARGKRYSYSILNTPYPSAIMGRYTAYCPYKLDFDKMKEASFYFIGTHDFSAFRSMGSSVKTSVRTVNYLELVREKDCIVMYIEADGFLYNMVRIIAGTLIEIGKGKKEPKSIADILNSHNRSMAGQTAPASGLCLEKIYYE
jgi:tRNA pseudouridine38-40 synthase